MLATTPTATPSSSPSTTSLTLSTSGSTTNDPSEIRTTPTQDPSSYQSLTAPTQVPSSTPEPAASFWDTGTKVGIGSGVALGTILLVVLATSVKRRRESWALKSPDPVEIGPGINRAASVKELDGTHWKRELQGNARFQEGFRGERSNGLGVVGRQVSRKELDGTHWKRELEGDTPRVLSV